MTVDSKSIVEGAPPSSGLSRSDSFETKRSGTSDEDTSEGLDKLDDPLLLVDDEKSSDSDKDATKLKPVAVRKLFRFATKLDIVLSLAGTFFSCASGVVNPVMIIIFSNLMGVILTYQTLMMQGQEDLANHHLDHESRKYCLWFLGLGILMWILSFGVNACWAVAAENQGLRIRKLYYQAIVRQDIGWFDTVKTGELTTRITNDVNLVQDGLGEKFGFVFMNVVAFVVSFIIALVKGWKLTLVCMSVLPFIAAAGGYLGVAISKLVTEAQDKTAASGAIADEVLSGIRTVMA
ncbi:hypothetical protein IWW38_005465, partial [Coemansia aciculifera]